MDRRLALALFVAGCGGGGPLIIGSDDIAISDASFPQFDATLPPDATKPPKEASVDSASFNGGGPFLCNGCVCDGTLNLCVHGGGGGGAPMDDAGDAGDDADASPCPTGPDEVCRPIPIQCLPQPTCGCIDPTADPCVCSVDPSGDGFVVTCPPNP